MIKNMFCLLWLLFGCIYIQTINAQTIEKSPLSIGQQMNILFGQLDYTEVTSNLLYDKGMNFVNFKRLNGDVLPDSLAISSSHWGYLCFQTNSMQIGNIAPIPNVESYMSIMKSYNTPTNIPIGILNFKYHYIDSLSVVNGLLSFDASTKTLHDVPNRPSSPYHCDTMVASTVLFLKSTHKTNQFYISDSLFYRNIQLPTSIEIDFQDGSGYRAMTFNNPLEITHTSYGTKYFTLKLSYSDGSLRYSKMQFIIEEEPVNYQSGSQRGSTYSKIPNLIINDVSGCTLQIFYANDCRKLRKPAIFIEGFNPAEFGNNDYNSMFSRLNVSQSNGSKTYTQYLYDNGYDLVYVDFTEGGGDMLLNSVVVQNVINWVNNDKECTTNGYVEKNLIIGASMGGVIGYHALRTMELAGKDLQTEKFISFDSPLNGSNIPLGLQALVKFLGDVNDPKGRSLRGQLPILESAMQVLLKPAAKQMLYKHIETTNNPTSTWHDAFYTTLAGLGTLSLPHIAMSNGSGTGSMQDLLPGGQLLKIHADYSSEDSFWGDLKIDYAEVYALNPVGSSWETIYKHKVTKYIQIIIGGYYSEEWLECKHTDNNVYDSAPGGMSDFGLGFLLTAGDPLKVDYLNAGGSFCFVPTVSALKVPGTPSTLTPINLATCSGSAVTKCITSLDASVVSRYSGAPQANQDHVTINTQNLASLLSLTTNKSTSNDIDPLSNRSFNMGNIGIGSVPLNMTPNVYRPYKTIDKIDKSIEIYNTGKLLINRNDKIDYTDITTNPQNIINNNFNVDIVQSACTPPYTTIKIYNGGEMWIGDNSVGNTSTVNVIDRSLLLIDNNGKCEVEGGSTLTVSSTDNLLKSVINIKSGGFLNLSWGGKLIIKKGGKMFINGGATLRVSHYSQLIVEDGGQLIIEPGANIQLWDGNQVNGEAMIYIKGGGFIIFNGSPNLTGNGYFRFAPNNNIIQNAPLDLIGMSNDHRLFYAEENAEIKWQNFTNIQNCKSVYENNSRMKCSGNYRYNFKDVKFDSPNNLISGGEGIFFDNNSMITVDNCRFKNLFAGVQFDNLTIASDFCVLKNSLFENNTIGAVINNSKGVRINNTTFNGENGIFAENVEKLYLVNNSSVNKVKPTDINGVKLTNVAYFELNNSKIDGFDNGSGILGTNRVNVKMYSKAAVKNCYNGININGTVNVGSADYGYVTMRCSELTNNFIGIIGQDILLDIDNGTQSNGKNANTFTTSSSGHNTQIFNINYVNRIVNTVNARGNYWMAPGSTPTAYNLTSQNNFVDLVTTPIVTSYPTLLTCFGIGNPPGSNGERIYSVVNGTDCEVVRNGHSVVLHEIYSSATALFDNEDYAQAELTYAPLAEISNAERNTMSTNCRLYIDLAKCRTYIPPAINHSELLYERNNKSVDNGNLKIYPNPTTNGFTIITDGILNQIEVFNTLGQKIYQKTIPTNNYFINTNDWESGIYLVKTKDTSGETHTTKVMVQKEIRN